MNSSLLPHPPRIATAATLGDARGALGPMPGPADDPEGDSASRIALRLSALVDADALCERLAGIWRDALRRPRGASGVELSVVEICGRTRGDRERDALRLLRTETAPTACALRATLVSLDPHEHLLMLTAAAHPAVVGPLAALAAELGRQYPTQSISLS
ncbi:MAG: hypothetical protein EHM87_14675 [Burkholderiales bacterium]|nr:MAG: hypothetical protein EHM87_14675 [Burkholderiales bacterium]